MRLPMATAIAQALLFKEGDHVFAIPVTYVAGTHAVGPAAISRRDGQWRALVRERWLPLLRLEELFGWAPPDSVAVRRNATLIELIGGGQPFAVSCRRIVGPREIVVKQLGPLLGVLPFFSGATVSGSGKVQLVLDVAALGALARRGGASVAPGHVSWSRRPRGVVLVADDSLSTREALGVMLRAAGYAVELAADGWEAWERLQSRHYDLLLTDLEMPRVHGTDLITRCRRHGDLATLPIVVITSRTAEQNLDAARRAGADDCLKKPVNRRVIIARIEALLQRPRA
jgi:chemosensory pili system protein ChpA (sensor histidine kinase/response regulator)